MERKVISTFVFFLLLGWAFLFSIPVLSANISLEFVQKPDSIELLGTTSVRGSFSIPWFKRKCGTIFLIISQDGVLLPCKGWALTSSRSRSNGAHLRINSSGSGNSFFLASFYDDFSNLETGLSFNSNDSCLFLTGLLNSSLNGALPPFRSAVYSLRLKKGKMLNLNMVETTKVPKVVLTTLEKEVNKIIEEEKSPAFGYW